MNKTVKKILIIILAIILLCGLIGFILNLTVVLATRKSIYEDYTNLKDYDCIIVLGAGIRSEEPSPMLKDRLDKAIELYNAGAAPKIIMTGDHGQERYDEVNVMKKYAIEHGVPSEDIFMDHAGFSTYDSMYREKEVFKVKKAIIVTQQYHMYRSLYIAKRLGIEAVGVPAAHTKYSGRYYREIREVLARAKDVFKCIFKPNPKYLGEEIDITGSGDVTND